VEKQFKEGNSTLSKSVFVDPPSTEQTNAIQMVTGEDPFWGQFPQEQVEETSKEIPKNFLKSRPDEKGETSSQQA
jgi:hypothetical protein